MDVHVHCWATKPMNRTRAYRGLPTQPCGYSIFRGLPDLGVLQIGIRAKVIEEQDQIVLSGSITFSNTAFTNEGADEEISDGGSPRVIVYRYDGLPMQSVAPPSLDYIPDSEEPQTPPVPQDEDEREPMFIQPHDPHYVSEPMYPEYIQLRMEMCFRLRATYLLLCHGDEHDERMRMKRTDDKEDEEDHLAPTDSAVVVPTVELVSPPEGTESITPPPSTDITTTGARITVRLQASISASPEESPKWEGQICHFRPPSTHIAGSRGRLECSERLAARAKVGMQRVESKAMLILDSRCIEKLLIIVDRLMWRNLANVDSDFSVAKVWEHLKHFSGISNIPSELNSIVDFLIPSAKLRSARSVIAKLIFFFGLLVTSFGKNIPEDVPCTDVVSPVEVSYVAYGLFLIKDFIDCKFFEVFLVRELEFDLKMEFPPLVVLLFPSLRFFLSCFSWEGFLRRQNRWAVIAPLLLRRDDFKALCTFKWFFPIGVVVSVF
ncbi:hypothetical protein Tco_0123396 [Tanacetum coccineum]